MMRPDRTSSGYIPNAFRAALLVGFVAFGALLSALLPLVMPLGFAAGGVLETGQVELGRWWLGCVMAILAVLLLSWRWEWRVRLYWLVLLLLALALAIVTLVVQSSTPVSHVAAGSANKAGPVKVGVITALPLFWPDGAEVRDLLSRDHLGEAPVPIMNHRAVPVDHVDEAVLRQVDAILLAQPRLLQPVELVRLDAWVRAGGRMLVLADPLLVWPGSLPYADPRRAPVTSLLDPLLTHWGLRLEAVSPDGHGVERRLLASGHVLMLAGASRFSLLGKADGVRCSLAERGLMALCHVGRGEVRLIADADLIDDRLWLADRRWPGRPEAWSADVPVLLDSWLAAPLEDPASTVLRRVRDEASLYRGLRLGLLALLIWAGLGALGQNRVLARWLKRSGGDGGDKGGTSGRAFGEREAGSP